MERYTGKIQLPYPVLNDKIIGQTQENGRSVRITNFMLNNKT